MANRPEPVLNAATAAGALTAAVGALLTCAVVFHWVTPEDSAILGPSLSTAITAVLGAVSAVVAALRARSKVTPLADPQDGDGTPLRAVTPDEAPAALLRAPGGQAGSLPSQLTPGPDHAAAGDLEETGQMESEADRQARYRDEG